MSDYMEGCPICEKLRQTYPKTIIENELASAHLVDWHREGQCVVNVKRHIISPSSLKQDEQIAVFDLITKVSKALEKKYSADKTYVLMIGDSNEYQHLHFHLIPKHKHLPSMGVYCFEKLREVEPPRETPDSEKQAIATEIKELIE